MNIDEIKSTIHQLEEGRTTFDNCFKLASLYTVLNHIDKENIKSLEIDDVKRQKYEEWFTPVMGSETERNTERKKTVIQEPVHVNVSRETISKNVETILDGLFVLYDKEKVIHAISDYIEDIRKYKPQEYSKMIDFIKSKC